MTALRKKTISLVEELPEAELVLVLNFLSGLIADNTTEVNDSSDEKIHAYNMLKQMIRPIPNLDEDEELAAYREEKYAL